MEVVVALMNAVFLVFIVSARFNEGPPTTVAQLTGLLRNAMWSWPTPFKGASSIRFGLVGLAILIGGLQQGIALIGLWILVAHVGAGLAWLVGGALPAPALEATRVWGLPASDRNAAPRRLATRVVVPSWYGKCGATMVGQGTA